MEKPNGGSSQHRAPPSAQIRTAPSLPPTNARPESATRAVAEMGFPPAPRRRPASRPAESVGPAAPPVAGTGASAQAPSGDPLRTFQARRRPSAWALSAVPGPAPQLRAVGVAPEDTWSNVGHVGHADKGEERGFVRGALGLRPWRSRRSAAHCAVAVRALAARHLSEAAAVVVVPGANGPIAVRHQKS